MMNNISERFERKIKREFFYFLDVAKSSAAEAKSMMYVAEDLQYLSSLKATAFRERLSKLITSIGALTSKIRKQDLRKTS